MSLFSRLFGSIRAARQIRQMHGELESWRARINAKYDGATQNNADLNEYWSEADYKSPHSSNSYEVRRRIRSRSRYECHESNGVAKRILTAKVGDVFGAKGPQLQMTSVNQDFNSTVEKRWRQWTKKTQFYRKGKAFCAAYYVDGESFAQRFTNPFLPTDEPQIDIQISESDLWTNPEFTDNPAEADGIQFDAAGYPRLYRRLNQHPGDDRQMISMLDYRDYPASDVIHWFKERRPGMVRGISEFAPALPLFALRRRYTLAVLGSAEAAASFSAVMQTDLPPIAGIMPGKVEGDTKTLNIFHKMITRLPIGWKIQQLKAEQPTSTYGEFCDAIDKEIGGVTRTPLNIVTGSSRDYNFSSGKLDYNLYYLANDEDRCDFESVFLDRVFEWWFQEAVLIPGYLPPVPENVFVDDVPHMWRFQPRKPIDEVKQAQADQINFELGFLTDEDYAFRVGRDPEEFVESRRKMLSRRIQDGVATPGNDTSEQELNRIEVMKRRLDAYGVGVRAGVITPTLTDEETFRQMMQFPEANDAIKRQWAEDGGVRRPITLVQDEDGNEQIEQTASETKTPQATTE